MKTISVVVLGIVFCLCGTIARAELRGDALAAAKKATSFLTDKVSTQGGYLWRYSADLNLGEGEGATKTETVWVQPPGTPAVGEAFVKLYRATGDPQFLDAAKAVADALRLGQMRSGGWQAMVEFEPDRRNRWAYRTDPPRSKSRDQSSLDDDKTQSALRFLIHLDQTLEFKDESIHEMTLYGLNGLLDQGQFSGGGFPQVWMEQRSDEDDTPRQSASYPDSWPRVYPGHNEYWLRYTLNDHLARDVMKVLFEAELVYKDGRYRKSAIGLADSLVAAQMPDPQPAWAQQYNSAMQPIWARKFEPPAITTSESFSVIDTLMMVYRKTGERKYLAPIGPALDYLKSCEMSDGQVARFYEMKTNRPLYFDLEYKLTYDDSDMPTHYGFKLRSGVDRLRKEYELLSRQPPAQVAQQMKEELAGSGQTRNPPSSRRVQQVIEALDSRGAWLSDQSMRYHKLPGPTIDMAVAVKNLTTLAQFLTPSGSR